MIYGLYLSAQGADVQSKRQDVIANNLANASTSAFKRDFAVFQAHQPHDVENGIAEDLPGGLNQLTGGISLAEVATDFRDGSLNPTGRAYDVALVGSGFLRVTDGQQEFLTRNGQLTRNTDGQLVTHESGLRVLSARGAPIEIPADARQIDIGDDGTIYQVNADNTRAELAKLDLVRPESTGSLVKSGDSLYRATGDVAAASDGVRVRQGFLEGSGTKPIIEMTELIETSRAFEANINMIKFQDEALGQLLQSMPRR